MKVRRESKPTRTMICDGPDRHAFQYPADEVPTRCPFAGCPARSAKPEMKLRG